MGDYSTYDVHDADLRTDRAYLFSKDLFPLAFVEIDNHGTSLSHEAFLNSIVYLNIGSSNPLF